MYAAFVIQVFASNIINQKHPEHHAAITDPIPHSICTELNASSCARPGSIPSLRLASSLAY